jgi:hypothetical protein
MMPVRPQPEPKDFAAMVRIPGNIWLQAKMEALGISPGSPIPPRFEWNALWTGVIDDAHGLYHGLCAYLACYIELSTGEVTIDHFKDKKVHPTLAYEWSNYRLASHGRNRLKRSEVLDPFLIGEGWFHLEFATGSIFPNPSLDTPTKSQVELTIKHLHLDEPRCQKDRMQYFNDYLNGDISGAFLKRMHPFVYAEASRQGLL